MKKISFLSLLLCLNSSIQCASQTIFAHGIVDGPSQMNRFTQAIATPFSTAITFPDALSSSDWGLNGCLEYCTNLCGKKVNRNAMFMGQKADLSAISDHININANKDSIILYGCSRGAAALITYLATYTPDNIKALVLDATPACIHETPKMTLAKIGINPTYCGSIFDTLFPAYDIKTAITPLSAIHSIKNKELPILLIHSQTDTVVHYTNSCKLYQEFLKAGFTNVHLAIIPSGRHSFLLQNESIKELYLQTVHSFYKKYNVPYDTKYAQDTVLKTTMTEEKMSQAIDQYDQDVASTYQTASRKNMIISGIICLLVYQWLKK